MSVFWSSTIWTFLAGIVKIIIGYWLYWRESEAEKKQMKKESLQKMKEGLKQRNPQMITDAFAKVKRTKK